MTLCQRLLLAAVLFATCFNAAHAASAAAGEPS
jgi:hypothetical protein